MYEGLRKNESAIKEINPFKFICNYNEGAYLEIKSSVEKKFKVEFANSQGHIEYSTEIGSNMWCKTNKKYVEEYTCTVKEADTDKIVFFEKYNPTGKRVYIALESRSLGDTMAWFPYIDEFRKKWNCIISCSTFHNNLFTGQYPELDFVSPGSIISNAYATYRIGLFFDQGKIDYSKHRKDPTKISLLEMATDILGLKYEEVRPRLRPSSVKKKKRVGIGMHSTAQTKYWNNTTGWQELTDFLISKGYEVVMLSKEEDGYMCNFYPRGVVKLPESSFDDLIDNLNSCEFFVGISSGLSWLAWAVNIPVVLISGFTGAYMEPTDNVVRIIEKSVCNDCWGRHKFDPGDWNWCPDHKGTPRQFECSKSITGKMVIDQIITSNLLREEDVSKNDEERILKFFEKKYDIEYLKEDILLKKKLKNKRSYVLYADEKYFGTVSKCAESIRAFSDLPIYVYMMNSDSKVAVEGTHTIKWNCEVDGDESQMYIEDGTNFYINRLNKRIYTMLIQRPLVAKHALENYSETISYVDCDSIATKNVDSIFEYYDELEDYPFFVEGIYDFFMMGSRGGVVDNNYSTSLEHPACELFGVDQSVRKRYRQTGYFVAGKKCIDFLEEWHSMCVHPSVVKENALYAPYNEETILNVLLWKKQKFEGLPYIYVNGGFSAIEEVYNIGFSGESNHIRDWVKIPATEEKLLFFHGEKNPENMSMMIESMKHK